MYVIPNFSDLLRENRSWNLRENPKNGDNMRKYYSNVYMIISQDRKKITVDLTLHQYFYDVRLWVAI